MIVARGPLAVRHRSPASFRGTLTMAAVTGLAMYDDAQKAGNEIRIEDHASLVKRIAYHMMLRMPASVQVDDLIQAGMIGLRSEERRVGKECRGRWRRGHEEHRTEVEMGGE